MVIHARAMCAYAWCVRAGAVRGEFLLQGRQHGILAMAMEMMMVMAMMVMMLMMMAMMDGVCK